MDSVNMNNENMEILSHKYMNDELSNEEITKEIVVYTYLNHYPKEHLYNYPQFFMNKLNNTNSLNDDNKIILQEYLNKNIDNNNIEDFFNMEFVTPELIAYVGW